MTAVPLPSFDHLLALSDEVGTFEHAQHAQRRRNHGYCTDDVARVAVLIAREPHPGPRVVDLGRTSWRFLLDSQDDSGMVRNRRAAGGRWESPHVVEDCWGRSLWAFGTIAGRAADPATRDRALVRFDRGAQQRAAWPRSMAFAALGAAEVLRRHPRAAEARHLLADAVDVIGRPPDDPAWPWPEPRLSYANAALAEVLLAAGDLLARPSLISDGLRMLGWLLDRETVSGHLSPTPVGGSGPGDRGPAFDQQPIEVAAMADACVRAAVTSDDPRWIEGVQRAARWFTGSNDATAVMWDPHTGGGFDGLHRTGANRNQGAESTIALISTLQHARRHVMSPA